MTIFHSACRNLDDFAQTAKTGRAYKDEYWHKTSCDPDLPSLDRPDLTPLAALCDGNTDRLSFCHSTKSRPLDN